MTASIFDTVQTNLITASDLTDQQLQQQLGFLFNHQLDYADLYFQSSVHESWVLEDGLVKDGSFNIERGVGVISNGKLKQSFGTYAEVKQRMRDLLNLSSDNEVKVFRHRRGEWGEWFESWSLVNGRPQITRSGWM